MSIDNHDLHEDIRKATKIIDEESHNLIKNYFRHTPRNALMEEILIEAVSEMGLQVTLINDAVQKLETIERRRFSLKNIKRKLF